MSLYFNSASVRSGGRLFSYHVTPSSEMVFVQISGGLGGHVVGSVHKTAFPWDLTQLRPAELVECIERVEYLLKPYEKPQPEQGIAEKITDLLQKI